MFHIERPHPLLYIVNLSAIWDIISHLWLGVTTGLKPTVLAICNEPGLLLRPATISRVFMAALWEKFGPALDQNRRAEKERLIRPHASSVIIDVGAGASIRTPRH